ncbi:MAG: AraC family transcriptional regulator [Pseudomonadota bacterium]
MAEQMPTSIVAESQPSKAELFLADAIDDRARMTAFEQFIYGDSTGYLGKSRLVSLSASNENYNRYERLLGNQIHASRLWTSGYAARANEGPDSDPHENFFLSICLSGEGELHTERNTERIRAGDVYINLSRNYRLWFSAGEYGRVVFPKRLIPGLDQARDEFVILRRDNPVTQVLRSAAQSVEDGIRSGTAQQAQLTSDLMVSVSQRVLENVLANPDSSNHNHLRDRAIDYIRDNLQRADLSVMEVANYVNASRATLYRAFENVGGLKEFTVSERISAAKSMLRAGEADRGFVATVAYSTGFTSPEQFSRMFKQKTGMSPTLFVNIAQS